MTGVTGQQQANAIHGTEGHAPADVHHSGEQIEHERPEDWGWHGETGKWGRAGAWFALVFLLLYILGNEPLISPGHVAVLIFAGLMVIVLLWDRRRRKNAWRSH